MTTKDKCDELMEKFNDAIPIPEDYNGEMIMRDYFEQVKQEIEQL
jgi:hypothetical protein